MEDFIGTASMYYCFAIINALEIKSVKYKYKWNFLLQNSFLVSKVINSRVEIIRISYCHSDVSRNK